MRINDFDNLSFRSMLYTKEVTTPFAEALLKSNLQHYTPSPLNGRVTPQPLDPRTQKVTDVACSFF